MPITTGPQVPKPPAEYEEVYLRAFRKQVLELLKMGYERIDAASFVDSEEQDITGELVRAMREVTEDRSVLERAEWAWRYAVHDDPAVNSPAKLGKRRPRLDICVERTEPGPHPHYVFEAKRLCSGSHGVAGYLGAEGLGAFLDGSYSAEDTEAGMLGYVQSGDSDEWAQKLCKKVRTNATSLRVLEPWATLEVTRGPSHCYRTIHNRPSVGQPITIYHVLLTFCNSN